MGCFPVPYIILSNSKFAVNFFHSPLPWPWQF